MGIPADFASASVAMIKKATSFSEEGQEEKWEENQEKKKEEEMLPHGGGKYGVWCPAGSGRGYKTSTDKSRSAYSSTSQY
jgi:hypothetical protein